MRGLSPCEKFRCAFRISNGFGGAETFILETEACLEKGYTILLSLSLSGRRHFDVIGYSFLCPSQHSYLGTSSTGHFLCEGFPIFVMTASLHSLLPALSPLCTSKTNRLSTYESPLIRFGTDRATFLPRQKWAAFLVRLIRCH